MTFILATSRIVICFKLCFRIYAICFKLFSRSKVWIVAIWICFIFCIGLTTERPQVDVSGLFDEMLRVMEEDEAYQESDILECIKWISPEQRSLLVTHIVNSSKVRSEPFSELPLHIYAHIELCMRQCLGKRMTAISDQSTSNLEDIKQAQKNNYHALYFVTGYILRSVQNAKNTNSQSADFIVEWVTLGFVHDIVTEWTDRVDRGGLTRPSQEFSNLIKRMDYIATHSLPLVKSICDIPSTTALSTPAVAAPSTSNTSQTPTFSTTPSPTSSDYVWRYLHSKASYYYHRKTINISRTSKRDCSPSTAI